MTFEQYPICKINDSVRIISKRFDKKISSNVSSELSQEIKETTGTILDAAYKIYSYLSRDDCIFAEFDEINKLFNDNAHNEEWSYAHTGNKLKDLYNIDYLSSHLAQCLHALRHDRPLIFYTAH